MVSVNSTELSAKFPAGRRVVALVGLAGLALGSLATLLLIPTPKPAWMNQADPDATVSVVTTSYADERQVATAPELSGEYDAFSPTYGVVRRADCAPGDIVASGQAPFVINNEPILLLHTDVPLWRDLEVGARGDDVASLETELVRLGYTDVSADGYFNNATGNALRALWAGLGVANRRSVPISSLIWLPTPEAVVSSCSAALGDQALPGQMLFRAGVGLDAITLQLPPAALPGAREAVVGVDTTTPVPDSGVITDAEFLAMLVRTRSFTEYQSGATSQLNVTVRLVEPVSVVSVPASALYDLTGAEGCVLADGEPSLVQVVASQFGQTLIRADPLPKSVLVRPRDAAPCR
ncbi:MAG: peptidoglycan-binding protein [Propionibacteriaceae bacterium]|jgi:hypothetical protein|nr:peptidoglycan-binding protein [Propionibacteriaceae bacterium]